MTDLAYLGLAIDSGPAVQAAADLDKLTGAAAKAEDAVKGVGDGAVRARADLSGIKASADALIAALNNNVAATAALTGGLSAMQAAGERAKTTLTVVGGTTVDAAKSFDAAAAAADRLRAKYDPLFAAAQRLAAATDEIRKAESGGVITTNVAIEALRKEALAYEDVAQAASRAANAARISAASAVDRRTVVPDRGADIAAYVNELDRLRGKFNPLFAAGQSYKATLSEISMAARVGAISQAEQAAAVSRTKDAFVEQVKGLRDTTEAAGLNRLQMMELGHVFRAVFDSVSAGQSPLRAIQMEGTRIAQVFTEGNGGVAGTLKAITGLVARATTGWAGLTVAIGGAALAAGGAALSYVTAQERLERAVEGTGRAAGVTRQQLDALASAGARQGNIGLGEGRSLAAGYAQAGVSGSLIGQAVGDTARFGRFTGQGTDEAGKALADALRDPERGAAMLGSTFGDVNDRLRTTIEDLEAQGQHAAAQRVLFDAFEASLKKTTDTTWLLGDAMRELKSWAGRVVDSTGGFVNHLLGGDQTAEQRLKFYQDQLPHTFDSPLAVGNLSRSYVQSQIDQAQREVTAKAAAAVDPAASARDLQANQLSDKLGPLIRSLIPEIARAQSSGNNLALLREALADPSITSRLSGGIGQAQVGQAYSRAAVVAANADPMARMRQDYDLSVASINAFSLAERAAVEARRAELAVLRETGDVSRAALAARQAENEAIVKGNEEAKRRLAEVTQNAGYVGLTPYERGRRQIVDRYEGEFGLLRGASGSQSEIAKTMTPVAADLKSAGDLLANTLRDIATKAAAAVAPWAGGLDRHAFDGAGTPSLGGAFGHAPAGVQAMINSAALQTGVPAAIIAAIGERENGFRLTGGTNILGADGRPASSAFGYGQLTKGAAADVRGVMPGFSQYDASTSVVGAATYLKILLSRFGDLTTALDHYGTGAGYGADILRRAGMSGAAGGSGPLTIRGSGAASAVNDNHLPAVAANTALGTYRTAEGRELGGYDAAAQRGPLDDATKALQAQRSALEAQVSTFGRSTEATAAAAERQRLLNGFQQEGIPLTDAMRTRIDGLSDAYGQFAKAQQDATERQRELTEAMDSFRDGARGALSSFVSDLRQGKSGVEALKSAMNSIADKLIDRAEGGVIDALFGRAGQFGQSAGGGGLFGGALSGLFGGAKFAAGGIMTTAGPVPLHAYATGGVASSPQVALFGEGRGPEAYVPLPDGKRIPVAMQGGGQASGSTDARSYSFDLRGSTLNEAQVQSALSRAIAANNSDRDRAFAGKARDVSRRAG